MHFDRCNEYTPTGAVVEGRAQVDDTKWEARIRRKLEGWTVGHVTIMLKVQQQSLSVRAANEGLAGWYNKMECESGSRQ